MGYKNFTLDDLFEVSYLTSNFRTVVFLPASYAVFPFLFLLLLFLFFLFRAYLFA
jgi:hypothetical protein